MGFDKDYPNRKDWRKPYYGSAAFDKHCRNHGACSYCVDSRTFQDRKVRQAAEDDFREWEKVKRMDTLDTTYCSKCGAETMGHYAIVGSGMTEDDTHEVICMESCFGELMPWLRKDKCNGN